MKLRLTIIALFFCPTVFSQRGEDTLYFKNFDIFINRTEILTKKAHLLSETTMNKKQMRKVQDSISFYAKEVKSSLKKLDSINKFLGMANYFQRGHKPARSQDLSSPVCQLQCSYSHYMQNLRNARDSVPEIVKAALVLETHLQKGYPESIYCPYIADEVKFGPGLDPSKAPVKKIIIPDSTFKKN